MNLDLEDRMIAWADDPFMDELDGFSPLPPPPPPDDEDYEGDGPTEGAADDFTAHMQQVVNFRADLFRKKHMAVKARPLVTSVSGILPSDDQDPRVEGLVDKTTLIGSKSMPQRMHPAIPKLGLGNSLVPGNNSMTTMATGLGSSMPADRAALHEDREPERMYRVRRGLKLPQLDLQVVMRHYVHLNRDGGTSIGVEQILAATEVPLPPPLAPIPAIAGLVKVPKLCNLDDEVALMPCKKESNRDYGLEIEQWREPIRDRNKDWRLDSQRQILGEQIMVLAGPLDRPRPYPRVRFMRRSTPCCQDYVAKPLWRKGKMLSEKCLYRFGGMVSDEYATVSIYGLGINGRVWGAGLRGSRVLFIKVYLPSCQQSLELDLEMSELEALFSATEEDMRLLQAGNKARLAVRLSKMLYFEYYEDELAFYRKLCISRGVKLTAAKKRRLEADARRKAAEEARKRRELEWMATPKRRRGLVVQRAMKMSGHDVVASVFEFPDRPQVYITHVYHRLSSTTYEITMGALQCAQAIRLDPAGGPKDHNFESWTPKMKYQICFRMLDRTALVEHEGETFLQVGQRLGLGGPLLELRDLSHAMRPQKQPHVASVFGTNSGEVAMHRSGRGKFSNATYKARGSDRMHWLVLREHAGYGRWQRRDVIGAPAERADPDAGKEKDEDDDKKKKKKKKKKKEEAEEAEVVEQPVKTREHGVREQSTDQTTGEYDASAAADAILARQGGCSYGVGGEGRIFVGNTRFHTAVQKALTGELSVDYGAPGGSRTAVLRGGRRHIAQARRHVYRGWPVASGAHRVQGVRVVFTLYRDLGGACELSVYRPDLCRTFRVHVTAGDVTHLARGRQEKELSAWYRKERGEEHYSQWEKEMVGPFVHLREQPPAEEEDPELAEMLRDDFLIESAERKKADVVELCEQDSDENMLLLQRTYSQRMPALDSELAAAEKEYEISARGLAYMDDPKERAAAAREIEDKVAGVRERVAIERGLLKKSIPLAREVAEKAWDGVGRALCERLYWRVPELARRKGDWLGGGAPGHSEEEDEEDKETDEEEEGEEPQFGNSALGAFGSVGGNENQEEQRQEQQRKEHRKVQKERRKRNEALGLVPQADDRELQLDRCVYKAMHKIASESEVVEGETYLLMSVYIIGNCLEFRAYNPLTSTEYDCEAPIDMRREYFESYRGLSLQERAINLQVIFVGFCISDAEGGSRQIVRLMA